jgi:membrane-associated phospholipid phosphatase
MALFDNQHNSPALTPSMPLEITTQTTTQNATNEVRSPLSPPIDPLTEELLLKAFPISRINWEEFQWYHVFLVLYIPIGLLLMIFRALLFGSQFLGLDCSELLAKWMMDIEELPESNGVWSDFPDNSVIVSNHHNAILEYGINNTMIKSEMFSIAAKKTNILPAKNKKNLFIYKARGQKLITLYQEFREKERRPLFLYPQGGTAANRYLTQFMPPIFEAMGPDDPIFCFATDIKYPFPIHTRLACSSLQVDTLWSLVFPRMKVKVAMLGPFRRGDFATAQEAAEHCQQVIAKAANKTLLPVDVFQKFKFVRKYKDNHGSELMMLYWMQSNAKLFKILFYPFTFLHILFKEVTLVFIAALMSSLQWNISTLEIIARSVLWVFLLTGLIKLYFKLPRPLWISSKIRLSKYVWQSDYSFPSAHSSFSVAMIASVIHTIVKDGTQLERVMAYPAIIVLLILVAITGVSRMMLGMHFPVDVFWGFGLGMVIPFLWIEYCDDWFVIKSNSEPHMMLLVVGCLALSTVIMFMYFHQQCNAPKHLQDIKRWNKKNQEAFQEQLKLEPKEEEKPAVLSRLVKRIRKKDAESGQPKEPKTPKLPPIEPNKMHVAPLQFGAIFGFLLVPPLQAIQGSSKFSLTLTTPTEYAVSLATMFGGMLVVGAAFAFLHPDRLIIRTILCTIICMWIAGYSTLVTKLALGK